MSVDLITDGPTEGEKEMQGVGGNSKNNDDEHKGGKEEPVVEKDARLEGKVVKMIWMKSKLDKPTLRDIWCVSIPSYHNLAFCPFTL